MKILIINKFLYPNGGSETYIFKLGEQLKKMGHEVQYFGMEHEGRCVGNNAESYTSDMDFHTGKLAKLLYPFKIIYSTEARKKLRVVLDDFKPDVVHVNNFNFQLTPSILYEVRDWERKNKSRIGHGIKLVYTAHDSQLVCPNHLMQQYISGERCTQCIGGSPWNCAKNKCIHGSGVKSLLGSVEAFIYRYRKTYGLFDSVICPSAFLKEKLDTLPELREKTLVMHNFMNNNEKSEEIGTSDATSNVSANQKPIDDIVKKQKLTDAISNNPQYIAYVGRYSEEKGIKTLLSVCKELPDVQFIMAGNGPLEDEVNATGNVVNVGFLNSTEVEELMKNARFVIFPSECNENCPFTVMESISYGTPVIGANIGGVPELIIDGENGILYESGDRDELLVKVSELWKNGQYLEKLKSACESVKYDSLEEYCTKLMNIYD